MASLRRDILQLRKRAVPAMPWCLEGPVWLVGHGLSPRGLLIQRSGFQRVLQSGLRRVWRVHRVLPECLQSARSGFQYYTILFFFILFHSFWFCSVLFPSALEPERV